jgi:hypothetical protein
MRKQESEAGQGTAIKVGVRTPFSRASARHDALACLEAPSGLRHGPTHLGRYPTGWFSLTDRSN